MQSYVGKNGICFNHVRAFLLLVLPTIVLTAATPASADGCPDGYSSTNLGFCYRVDSVRPNSPPGSGLPPTGTVVNGVVIAPRAYKALFLGIALYKNGKVACKAVAPLNDVEKGESAFMGMCSETVTDPEKSVLRVDAAVPAKP